MIYGQVRVHCPCLLPRLRQLKSTTSSSPSLLTPINLARSSICLLLRHSGTLLPARMSILFTPSLRTTRLIGKSSSLQPFSSLVHRTPSRNATRNHHSRCSTRFCKCNVMSTLVHDQRRRPALTLYKSNIYIQEYTSMLISTITNWVEATRYVNKLSRSIPTGIHKLWLKDLGMGLSSQQQARLYPVYHRTTSYLIRLNPTDKQCLHIGTPATLRIGHIAGMCTDLRSSSHPTLK